MLEVTEQDGVRVLRMAHGKASALDVEFANALSEQFAAEADKPEPLVLTGTGRIFSAGVDLIRLLESGDDYVDDFLAALDTCFERLFALEKPVVGAVNGHAIAGGCILVACCDVSVMVDEGAGIGVPELAVGVPFPPLPLEILRFAVGDPTASRLAIGCETLTPAQAQEVALVQKLTKPDELMAAAVNEAHRLGAMPTNAFALVKRQLRAPALQRAHDQQAHAEEVKQAWKSPQVKAALQAYVDKTLRK